MILLALGLAAMPVARPLPAFCAQPALAAERITCADPRLRALARASLAVARDLSARSGEPWQALMEDDWPAAFDRCQTRGCVEEAYGQHLSTMMRFAQAYGGVSATEIRGATRFHGSSPGPGRSRLALLPLGEGWGLYVLRTVIEHGAGGEPMEDREGQAIGVVALEGGRGRAAATAFGVDGALLFEKQGAAWRITQVGDCDCGHGVTLDGRYAPLAGRAGAGHPRQGGRRRP